MMHLTWQYLCVLVVLVAALGSSNLQAGPVQAGSQPARMKMLVVHGPNLNLLGRREPQVYGTTTLDQINTRLGGLARDLNVELITMQSNDEGAIVDAFQKQMDVVDGALINAAGL